MASYLRKMIATLVAVFLVVVAMQSQAQVEEVAPAPTDDMVPVTLAQPVVMGIAGGGGVRTLVGPVSACLECRCCSRSNLSNCKITECCSNYNCDSTGNCTFLQQRCGCSGC